MRLSAADGYTADSVVVDGVERRDDVAWLDPETHEVCLFERGPRGGIAGTHVVTATKLKVVGLRKRGPWKPGDAVRTTIEAGA